MNPTQRRRNSTRGLIYPFSYYGGKVKLFAWIAQNLPPAHAFVDAYGGSGVVALNLVHRYKRVVYNDLDWRVNNFFWVLRDFPDQLIAKLKLTPISRLEHERSYEDAEDPIEQARKTFVRITQSYGKIGTRNVKSGWLLPCVKGNRVSAVLSTVEHLEDVVERLISMELEHLDAVKLIKKENRADTVIFADPPYVHSSRNCSHGYLCEMNDEDHVDMCNALNESDSNAVVCGYENDIYNDLLSGWRVVKKEVKSVSAASKRKKDCSRVECLWIKR